MMTIAICEDEHYFLTELSKLVNQYLKDRQLQADIMTFEKGEELLAAKNKPDIILMDIKLPGQNGMQITQQLRKNGSEGQFIFITAYEEYVFKAFEVDAVHYILKPVQAPQLYSALDKAMKRRIHCSEKVLLINNGSTVSRIPIKDILYCEVFNHQVSIHTPAKEYSYSSTLDAIEKELDDRFFRCHRSFLVNMDFVMDKDAEAAFVAGGHKVLIARRKQQEFTRKLLESCRREKS